MTPPSKHRRPAGGAPIAPAADDPRRCHVIKKNGEQCGRWAIKGGRVCGAHGGDTPAVRRAARRRLQREQLERKVVELLQDLDLDVDQDASPADVLSSAVGRAADMARMLEVIVGQLAIWNGWETARVDGDPVPVRVEQAAAWFGPDHLSDGAPHVATEMLRQWNEQAAKLAKWALDAGLEERRVRVAEEQGRQLADVLRATVAALQARALAAVEEVLDARGVPRAALRRDLVAGLRSTWESEAPAIVRQAVADVTSREVGR